MIDCKQCGHWHGNSTKAHSQSYDYSDPYGARPVTEIDRARYWEMLEMLYPVDWCHTGGESFKFSEHLSGDRVMIFCTLGRGEAQRYFELVDSDRTLHRTIVARCKAYIEAGL